MNDNGTRDKIEYFRRMGKGINVDSEIKYIIVEQFENKFNGSVYLDSYWFLEELIKFESQFTEYLKEEVSRKENYLTKAEELVKKMIHEEDKEDEEDARVFNVLNFNYTNPFKSIGYSPANMRVTNVHGTCEDDNIIFGVDMTTELPPDTHIFTKTYRKMLQGTPDNSALPWRVDEIKFYGHSLGKLIIRIFKAFSIIITSTVTNV